MATARWLGVRVLFLLLGLGALGIAYLLLLVVLASVVRVVGDPADWPADTAEPCTLVLASGVPECTEDLGGPGFVLEWPWSAD